MIKPHTHTYTYIHTYTHIHTHTTHTHTHTYIHIHTHIHTYTYIYINVYITESAMGSKWSSIQNISVATNPFIEYCDSAVQEVKGVDGFCK